MGAVKLCPKTILPMLFNGISMHIFRRRLRGGAHVPIYSRPIPRYMFQFAVCSFLVKRYFGSRKPK